MRVWLGRWWGWVGRRMRALTPGRPGRRYPVTGHENAAAVRRALLLEAIRELKGAGASREGTNR